MKGLGGNKRERKLRVATWNFSGLGSERKQKEVEELLAKNNIDVVAGQESWEREDTRIEVEDYKWKAVIGGLKKLYLVLEKRVG